MKKALTILTIITALSSIISSSFGVFYTTGGETRNVENIYGQQVMLFGDGIYANDSLLKAGATKGADVIMIAAGLILLTILLIYRNRKACQLIQSGLLLLILYATTCLIMGMAFNRLFLLYVIQFGSSLFAFVLSLINIMSTEPYDEKIYEKHFKGIGVFLLISGCSVLIWLTFILPVVITGQPLETIETYTTEPTFALDLGIIFPATTFIGIALLKRMKIGYRLAPVIMTMLIGVGLCVIFQTIFQTAFGIILEIGQMFGLVGTFVILGIFAVVNNIRLLKYAKV